MGARAFCPFQNTDCKASCMLYDNGANVCRVSTALSVIIGVQREMPVKMKEQASAIESMNTSMLLMAETLCEMGKTIVAGDDAAGAHGKGYEGITEAEKAAQEAFMDGKDWKYYYKESTDAVFTAYKLHCKTAGIDLGDKKDEYLKRNLVNVILRKHKSLATKRTGSKASVFVLRSEMES